MPVAPTRRMRAAASSANGKPSRLRDFFSSLLVIALVVGVPDRGRGRLLESSRQVAVPERQIGNRLPQSHSFRPQLLPFRHRGPTCSVPGKSHVPGPEELPRPAVVEACRNTLSLKEFGIRHSRSDHWRANGSFSSPRRSSSTMQISSSAECCFGVLRRMSFTRVSAGGLHGPDFNHPDLPHGR